MQLGKSRPQLRARGIGPSQGLYEHEYRELIVAAYQYGFPIFEQARLIYNFSYTPTNPRRVPANSFAHARCLTGVAEQKVTTPNNDTLYSSAVIDLSGGPVWLNIPDFADRYYSIALFDAFTNVFHCIGSRSRKPGSASFLLAGPEWKGHAGQAELVQSPGNHVIILVRIHADGPAEYPLIHALQDQLTLQATGAPKDRTITAPLPSDPANFVAVVNQVLRENPPPDADSNLLEQLCLVGMGPEAGGLLDYQANFWRTYFPLARVRLQQISASFGRVVAGWEYPPPSIGDFGTDYVARAAIGLKGLWANTPAEQTYTLALTDQDGEPLIGTRTYKLQLPKERARDGAFWSLSMYACTPQGQLVFAENEIQCHAIKSDALGLGWNSDGSLDISIAPIRPPCCEANWLPSPPGQFAMVMRVYVPKTDKIGKFEFYPPVIRQRHPD